MRFYVTSFDSRVVNLDDRDLYNNLPDNVRELDDMMFKEIGSALCYMNNFYPDVFHTKKTYKINPYTNKRELDGGYAQRLRVLKLIEHFCVERKNHYNDVLWLQEQLYLFMDETENMC